MGLYAIDCPQCSKPFMWFSGNMDQRCHECKNPKTWWLPLSYHEDSIATRQEANSRPGGSHLYVEVIVKSAFDAQCRVTEKLVSDYNALLYRYNELLENSRNPKKDT